MPATLRERNPWKESTKKAVKTWVKENVGSRGEDHILWGRWQTAEAHEEGKEQKRKKPPTSNKQMKKCGEPLRKGKREEKVVDDIPEKESMGKDSDQGAQKLTRKEERKKREDRRVAREVRRQKTKENKLQKEKRKKLANEKLEKEGQKRNKNQLILREWLKGGSMVLPNQGGTGGGKPRGGSKKGGVKKGIG